MKRLSASLLSIALALLSQTGCGKKEARTPSPAPQATQPKAPAAEAATPDAPPPPPPGTPAAPTADAAPAKEEAVDPDVLKTVLNATQSFVIAQNRSPKSLDELVSAGYLKKLPSPPPGKKFFYDPAKLDIKLVNQ